MALALRADHPHEVEAAAHPAAAEIGDATDQRPVAIAACERVHRRVQGTQPGGAGRAIRGRRPHEVEVIGDPIGQHGKADAGHGILGHAMLRPPVGHGRNLRADEDSGGAVAQRAKVPADMFDGLPRAVEQHPYLRLGLPQFVVGHAEERAVEEQLVVVANQSLVSAREPPWAGKLPDGQVASSVAVGDRLLDDLALGQQRPEIGIRLYATGHAMAVPDDGNAVVRARQSHAVIR